MAGYIGTQAVSVNTTSATISDDLVVGDDALITGVLTATDGAIFNGGLTTDGALITGGTKLLFRDSGLFLNSSTNGQLDIDADTELELTAPTIQLVASTKVDLDGNLDVSGTALVTGVLTTTAATVFNGGFSTKAVGTIKHTDGVDNISLASTSTGGVLNVRNSSGTAVITLDGRNSLVTVGDGLVLSDGDLVVAAGHGINFAAQTSANDPDDIITTSELLDHYEEGTFIPTLVVPSGSIGYSGRTASYTRVGRLVTVTIGCILNSISSPSGATGISGLPFPADSGENFVASVTFGIIRNFVDDISNVRGYVNNNATNVTFSRQNTNAGHSALDANQYTSSTLVYVSITYHTDT